ncbi:MAG TPA: hypothetical protein VFK11_03465 [Candidatus Saccharimonadales bacterium]|nr:hypothetical protein [Candidatus Saccharimonadales bacterium]
MGMEQGEQVRICPIREHSTYETIMREMIKNGALKDSSVVAVQMVARTRAAQSPESACPAKCDGVIKEPRAIGPIKLPSFMDIEICPNPPSPEKY